MLGVADGRGSKLSVGRVEKAQPRQRIEVHWNKEKDGDLIADYVNHVLPFDIKDLM